MTDGTETLRDRRPRTPDTVEEWMDYARNNYEVLMLEAEEQTVFVYYHETDGFDRGYTWVSNSIDPQSGVRADSYTHENLIERWFREAVPRSRVWAFNRGETPLRGSGYVE